MKQLQGTFAEGVETLERIAYNRFKIGSSWIRNDGWAKGRKYWVSCRRGGKVYLLWEPYRGCQDRTMSRAFDPCHILKYYTEAKAKGE